MSFDIDYTSALIDSFMSPTYEKLKHRHDDFWERVEEGKRKTILNCAREFREDAPWGEITKQLTVKDIDFIREFKDKINWEELGHEIKYNSKIYKEFKKDIENEFEARIKFNTDLLDAMLSNFP